jgi:two-component system, NarL family, nitrate/nitrite response regulator NarL
MVEPLLRAAPDPAVRPAARVLVTGASEVIRLGLCAMLAALPEVATVQESGDLAQATGMLAASRATVVLAASPLPAGDYGRIAEAAATGDAATLVLLRDCGTAGDDLIGQALALPADGYLFESALTRTSLADTLRQLAGGQSPMPQVLARGLMSRLRANETGLAGRPFLLTAREMRVLSLMADGHSNKEIARRLGISEHGAKRHVACVLAKLNCSNRTAAAALFLQHGVAGFR